MSETIVSLQRNGTAVLMAESVSGKVKITALAEAETASLSKEGRPDPLAEGVIGSLLREAGAPRQVRLLLPATATALKRAEVSVPVSGRLSGAVLDQAIAKARASLHKESHAFVLLRPVAYRTGEQRRAEPPLGESMRDLVVEMMALTAPVRLLADFDAVMRGAGAQLAGVVAAPMAAAAGLLGEEAGALMLVGHEETLAVRAEDGLVSAQARVPIGRRHMVHDLSAAFDLSPEAAAAKLAAVLGGRAGPEANHVVRMRIAELENLISAAAARAGLDLTAPFALHGLPPEALPEMAASRPAPQGLPRRLADAPLLGGAAKLALGFGPGLDEAVLTSAPAGKEGLLSWLKKRF